MRFPATPQAVILATAAILAALVTPASAVNYPTISYGAATDLAPGAVYRHASDTSVPWQIDIIEVDLTNKNIDLVPVYRQTTLEKTSTLATRVNAVAAINAGYFDSATSASYSYVRIDGVQYANNVASRPPRTTFGVSNNHNATLVAAPIDSTGAPVPSNPAWAGVIDGIGGGPNLLTAGAINNTEIAEETDSTSGSGINSDTRNPRTFLGWNSTTRKAFLVTVDGRQTGWSVGMTCTEGAKLLQDLGCDYGLNYDGGGSTTCWANGVVKNRPSDGTERLVASAWAVVPRTVIDNTDAEFAAAGTWPSSANAGYFGSNSQYHFGNAGLDSVTWTPNLAREGQYKVYAWWVAGTNRAAAAPIDVFHYSGVTTVPTDQRINGGEWNLLGTFNLNSGTANSVAIWDNVPSTEVVSADAVSFVYTGPLAIPPVAPSGLVASTPSAGQINLSWADNATNESNYVVARSTTSGGPYTDISTLAANTTSYVNTGLPPLTTYYYVVRATNSSGASGNSNQASATTQNTAPAAPSGLATTAIMQTQINIAWTDNSSNESNFVVERKTGNGAYSVIATLAANIRTFNNTGLVKNTSYTYRVKATNAVGNSAYSSTVTAKTLR